jgi:hypothetical protein
MVESKDCRGDDGRDFLEPLFGRELCWFEIGSHGQLLVWRCPQRLPLGGRPAVWRNGLLVAPTYISLQLEFEMTQKVSEREFGSGWVKCPARFQRGGRASVVRTATCNEPITLSVLSSYVRRRSFYAFRRLPKGVHFFAARRIMDRRSAIENRRRFPSAQTVRQGPTGPVRLLLGGEAHRPLSLGSSRAYR